jgi:hypothetical protein
VKKCSKCGEIKSLDQFHNDKNRLDGLYVYCKPCKNQENRQYKANPSNVWKFYKIHNQDGSYFTITDYNRAFQIQGGRCKGCGKHQSELNKKLFVDHNHDTGIFRGLLCHSCNIKVDKYSTPEILRNLATYLEYNTPKNTRQSLTEDVLRTNK